MKNLVNWIEIPVLDMDRAKKFYSSILQTEISPFDIGDVSYGLFPTEDQKNTGALAKGPYYKPSMDGVVLYLDGGADLNIVLQKVETAGGQVIMQKTFLSPEAGYISMFLDTEGNKIGLQSYS